MMSERRSIRLPIFLGVTMIVLLIVLTIGWILLNAFAAGDNSERAPLFWTLLSVGTSFLVFVLVGVVMYLTLSIKAINLTRRQSNFIDSVSHELKSPIAALKLYLQTLNRRQVTERERQNFHRFMLEDVERLDQLINHLLDAGRIEKKTTDDELENIELASLLQDCAEAVAIRYDVDRSAMTIDTVHCKVRARRVDLQIIFRNLIDNAVKYTADDLEINIESRMLGENKVMVRIIDNGRGIPISQRRSIFGRFVRLGLELERDKPGTGLGLYIVHNLVRRLRGAVRVQGRAPKRGTIFEVELPAVVCLRDNASDSLSDPTKHVDVV